MRVVKEQRNGPSGKAAWRIGGATGNRVMTVIEISDDRAATQGMTQGMAGQAGRRIVIRSGRLGPAVISRVGQIRASNLETV
jgi:hypothetical protein